MILLFLPSLAFALPSDVDESTVVPVDVLLGLEKDPEPEGPPATWFVQRSELTIEPQQDFVVEVAVDLEIVSLEETWVELRVLDGRVRLYDEVPGLHQGGDGHWWFTGEVDGLERVQLRGTLGGNEQLSLRVAPGVRQEAHGVGDGLDFEIFGAVGDRLPPTELVEVAWSPKRPPAPVQQVVQGAVSTAAWIEDGDLRVRSSIRWTVRRGELAALSVQLPGAVTELDVVGAGVESWSRSGATVQIQPSRVVDGVFETTLEWRLAFTKNAAAVQQPTLPGTTSTNHSLTLAGSSELVLSPTVSGSMRPGAVAELDEKARSIGDAPPTAAWTGAGTLSLKALSLTSLEGPALVIDQAVCTEASAAAGRNLLSCRLDVRNASRQYLRVTPAEGGHLWSATVNGRGVTPVVLEDGTTGIPLERSVETLAGMTTLDVELIFAGQDTEWTRKGTRSRALPAFDAPVAQMVWELRLPPGFEGKIEGGSAREGQEAATEIVYATSTEEKTKNEEARNSWNEALRAYQRNDFDAAQGYIDQTLVLDSGNENAMRLQGNLDVLAGDQTSSTGGDEAMSRRVKDMAKAKVAEVEVKQEDTLKEAERRLNSGDYDGAIALYEELEKSSEELSRYEQDESKEQAYYSSSSSAGLKEAKKRASYKTDDAKDNAPSTGAYATPETVVLDRRGEANQSVALSSDLLESIPAGRDYQSALSAAPGVIGSGNANMAGAASNDNDGAAFGWGGLEAGEQGVLGTIEGGVYGSSVAGASGAVMGGQVQGLGAVEIHNAYGAPLADAEPPAEPEPKPEPVVVYQHRTEIDFEDIEISGELVKPQGQLILDSYRGAAAAPPPPEAPQRSYYVEQDPSGGYSAYEMDELALVDEVYEEEPYYFDDDGDYAEYEQYAEYEDYDSYGYGEARGAELDFATSTVELSVQSVPGVNARTGPYEIATPEETWDDYTPVDVPEYGTPLSTYVDGVVYTVESAVYSWQHPPPPVTERPTPVLSTLPDLAATTLAIPLPDHGKSLSVVQRLLAPGEASTLEITYRETR
ncbi:MAG: hypothetical protein GY884_26730 [Proteobacteria bacterium]|nr:hypothetical protein [Pseudomonadota bacterium]